MLSKLGMKGVGMGWDGHLRVGRFEKKHNFMGLKKAVGKEMLCCMGRCILPSIYHPCSISLHLNQSFVSGPPTSLLQAPIVTKKYFLHSVA